MRKLYNEFFDIPKHEKIREKVMLARIVTTITIMIVCLAAMSITAYAYFYSGITSGSNMIKAAHFEANVSITITDSNHDPVTVTKDGKVQTANLDAGKYIIELTKENSTAHQGFCVITIGDKIYYTDQIGVDVDKNLDNATVKFELRISSPTRIEVLSHWGTSVYYGYKDADRTEIFIVSGDTVDLTVTERSEGSEESADTSDMGGQTESPPTDSQSVPSTTESTPLDNSPPETTDNETLPLPDDIIPETPESEKTGDLTEQSTDSIENTEPHNPGL